MIVLDASACVELLLRTTTGVRVAAKLRGNRLRAPHLLDIEVIQVMRRLLAQRVVTKSRAEQALDRLQRLRLVRHEMRALTSRIWARRDNLSAYDASYVCLAISLNAPLLTCDRKLVRAVGDDVVLIHV